MNLVDGVILLHGIARTRSSMRVMERTLVGDGYRTLNLGYDSRHKPLEALAQDIHPAIMSFQAELDGSLHFVTHSMGGLVARVYLKTKRPQRLGRVVMLGPPHNGSAVADILQRNFAFRMVFGPAGQELTTDSAIRLQSICGPADFALGIIAGNKSNNPLASTLILREPNDGKVTVRSTRLAGATDHVVLPVSHTFMTSNSEVVASSLAFLRRGRFA